MLAMSTGAVVLHLIVYHVTASSYLEILPELTKTVIADNTNESYRKKSVWFEVTN
jgi:hypothetical protein